MINLRSFEPSQYQTQPQQPYYLHPKQQCPIIIGSRRAVTLAKIVFTVIAISNFS